MFGFLKGLFREVKKDTRIIKSDQDMYKKLLVVKYKGTDKKLFKELVDAFERSRIGFGVDTDLKVVHFWAQMAHETGGFRWMRELGSKRYFQRYEYRKNLGNTAPGDGYKYRGRGIIQITGKYNYSVFGQKIGIDLVKFPEKAMEPQYAMLIALHYWQGKGLNGFAELDDIKTITRRINGGYNGFSDRKAKLRALKKAFNI